MFIDVDGRGSGKTTRIIRDAYFTGYPIICATMQRKKYIEQRAREMNINAIVYAVSEIQNKICLTQDVLVDELEEVLNQALGAHVIKANMSRNDCI